jgi:hypothetical protein
MISKPNLNINKIYTSSIEDVFMPLISQPLWGTCNIKYAQQLKKTISHLFSMYDF